MKLSTKIITAVVLVASSSGAVYAYNKHSGWGMSPEEKLEFVTERVTRKLELDSLQQQNFVALGELVGQILGDAKATRKEHLTEIGTLLEDSSLNQARALELIQQKTRMINEKAPQVIASLAIFLDSLNAEQKQEMLEFVKHHREHSRHGGHS